ncbi:hypothetical protein [Streptomyces alboniger]|uniref:hypothetical protein n=1 Tax=Streptomyces alboniger TaxID=132473 RepID=UPI001FE5CC81|nr:hypothetical protein [Streptomyces alboniger]
MNEPRRSTRLALKLATLAAAATLPVAGLAPSAVATPSQEASAAANILTCHTDTDGRWGHAHCKNNTNVVKAFRVTVVCGVWPDTSGPWKTLRPGHSDVSSARCNGGTGVGSVGWQEG